MLPVLENPSQPRPRTASGAFFATAVEPRYVSGFYAEESEPFLRFRWMEPEASLAFDPRPEPRFLEMWIVSEFHDLSQELEVVVAGSRRRETLAHGWHRGSFEVPAGADTIELRVNKPFPKVFYPRDPRNLAMRVGAVRLHSDRERHLHVRRQYHNAVHNRRETLAGAAVLESHPTCLGIDMYGVCNVKPPCVYCEWDLSKAQEGDNVDAPFTPETLAGYGDFFELPDMLINCSIGEPFMMKEIDELLELFGERGKILEVATNGQILTDRNIRRLLGREIHLYVSLDAATPETYARLRNDKFDRILHNLRRLIAAKGGKGHPPFVYLIFMPMKVNLHEAEAFVRLCADLGADHLILRPLNAYEGSGLDWERSGYHFHYQNELLPVHELVKVSGRMAALCERLGVSFSDQMDFGGAVAELFPEDFAAGREELGPTAAPEAADAVPVGEPAEAPAEPAVPADRPSLGDERLPLCLEPWKSLYVLRRGVYPCCHGAVPVADMADYGQAWNSPLLQEIRTELAAGRFHDYCASSTACPIVRKAAAQGIDVRPAAARAADRRPRSLWRRAIARLASWGRKAPESTAA